ncbi:MAG: phosphoribosylaminoimidazolesuccinocarboxamide synthase [Candidatus Coatesbacteria bacterium]|nr:phosphoribosylaminoimidazolesuccinocarboxamide synthase [Candidatus Coatesbacteria bacterium]
MKLYEGKAKILETTDNKDVLIQLFKDDLTAFNAEKKDNREGKGALNNQTSSILFEYLQKEGIKTHFIKVIDNTKMMVQKVSIFKIEVVLRNVAAGSIVKRIGIQNGTTINPAILEFYYKDDALGDPLINQDHIRFLNLAKSEELEEISVIALKVNDLLKSFFIKRDLILVDLKLEFGRNTRGEILLADEISADTCRLWDAKTRESLDKDIFREDKGDVLTGYREVLKRLKTKR